MDHVVTSLDAASLPSLGLYISFSIFLFSLHALATECRLLSVLPAPFTCDPTNCQHSCPTDRLCSEHPNERALPV
ncbi:hypothetical protein BD289DRAFT_277961 [Coniella lustricola]|uniref:Uncharacterized protein n=1 Tax=Coniella lustricola TaxID=2025994 RepID=A0A2T3A6A5_9PEZI|nr:hypothetical protein BD289DRAFT_277961 [Coniella lustricola]